MHFVCENDDTDAKFFQRPHGECKHCKKCAKREVDYWNCKDARNFQRMQVSCNYHASYITPRYIKSFVYTEN